MDEIQSKVSDLSQPAKTVVVIAVQDCVEQDKPALMKLKAIKFKSFRQPDFSFQRCCCSYVVSCVWMCGQRCISRKLGRR